MALRTPSASASAGLVDNPRTTPGVPSLQGLGAVASSGRISVEMASFAWTVIHGLAVRSDRSALRSEQTKLCWF